VRLFDLADEENEMSVDRPLIDDANVALKRLDEKVGFARLMAS
jgi:hypothetical protein